jgi:glycosyltransferase involved in cell wall biosynthesis
VPQDPRVIADRLNRILDDPAFARDVGCRGQEKVRRKYAWEAIAGRHLDIYRELS